MRYLTLLFALYFVLNSCSSAYTSRSDAYSNKVRTETAFNPASEDRKILLSAYLDLTVVEPDSSMAELVALGNSYGGYLGQASPDNVSFYVPSAKLEALLDDIATMGKVKDQRITAEDVTEEFYDAGIRLENAEKSRQRYLELLQQAKNVEETILVEKELQRLTETIDLLKGQRQRMNQREAFSSVYVNLERKTKLGPLGYVFKGAYSVVRWLFVWN